MRALLDTHAFIWWLYEDRRLSTRARDAIASGDNEIVFSAICGWELAIKSHLLRRPRTMDVIGYVTEQVSINRFQILPFSLAHALRTSALPNHHRDPFDRALVAQALVEDLTLISADHDIVRYDVRLLW